MRTRGDRASLVGMRTTSQEPVNVPPLGINLSEIPALLDANGIRKHLAPLGRTLLYELATRGDIETASLGLGRGKRVFVTTSVVKWLERRAAESKRPNLANRKNRLGSNAEAAE